jgi:hypothetical protein
VLAWWMIAGGDRRAEVVLMACPLGGAGAGPWSSRLERGKGGAKSSERGPCGSSEGVVLGEMRGDRNFKGCRLVAISSYSQPGKPLEMSPL